jgi:hypothetical protein
MAWTTERLEFESRYGQVFSLLYFVETDSEVHPTSNTMDTEDAFPGIKRPGHEVDPSPPNSAYSQFAETRKSS